MTAALRCGLLLLSWAALAPALQAQPVKTEHVTAELVAERSAVAPGGTLQIGLLLQHAPQWHSYWRNPGDSGLPTTIDWQLPSGAAVGPIEWPAPERLPLGPLVNYGYEGELLLPLAFTAPADARPGSTLALTAHVRWLVCREVCIPEEATLRLQLPVAAAGTTPGSTAHTALFERAAAARSVPLQGWTAEVQRSGRELLLTLERDGGLPVGAAALPPARFFPFAEQLIETTVHQAYATPRGYAWRLRLGPNAAELPAALEGIAVADSAAAWGLGSPMVEFSAPWREVAAIALPAGARPLAGGGAPASLAGAAAPAAAIGIGVALLLALAGGALLNLMPCVFPVLSIKLLGLTRQAAAPAALRLHALAYGAGVLGSFLALALGLIALQAAGQAVGWGFQLQEPAVVFALALLFCLIGLNLMGGLEFTPLLPQRLAAWRSAHPAADAFGAGVLAVVAATPCTAPFMGAALGYALTQPPPVALAVFAALGLGMALPYAALVLLPGWRSRLPRPGAWMLHLKQALAFPMFATAVWLAWVLGQQAGVGAMARLLLVLVGAGAVAWAWHAGLGRGWAGRAAGVAALAALLAWSWPAAAPDAAAAAAAASPAEDHWLSFDEAEIDRLLAEGRPVFVDFTAAWCVSCQVNKRLVLDTAPIQAAFAQAGVTLMRADWTRRDAVITQALARLGRNGVPVYVLHRPGQAPLLLPEILSPGAVRDALATLQPLQSLPADKAAGSSPNTPRS
ncbi:MAG TPA: protein-disulfide reductase DsbD family protein [Rubrivivax sp.]|nr:protein-disulfide reductase DsbD family protein [Rubrivivax sp.]